MRAKRPLLPMTGLAYFMPMKVAPRDAGAPASRPPPITPTVSAILKQDTLPDPLWDSTPLEDRHEVRQLVQLSAVRYAAKVNDSTLRPDAG